MGTTWFSQIGGALLLPDSEGPLQELDPRDRVTQCTAGAGQSQTYLMIPEAATGTPVISTSISKMLYYVEENKRTFR